MRRKHSTQYRLPYFNYASSAYYFITICSKNRKNLFGIVKNGIVELSPIGKTIEYHWFRISQLAAYITLDAFQIMPNHLHGILLIDNPDEAAAIDKKLFQPRKNSLSIVIRNFKAAVTANLRLKQPDISIWQPRFFDRIIRNERELHAVRRYIKNNPLQWEQDKNQQDNLLM